MGINIQVSNTEQKELFVNNTPEVSLEQFDFGIKDSANALDERLL